MGHPNSSFTLGIPLASSDGRFYSRYPLGDRFGLVADALGQLSQVIATTPSGAAASVISSAFAPLRTIIFDGLADGARVDSQGTVGKRFDYWGEFKGGYGSQATTSIHRPGRTSCCAMSISEGNTGRPGDGQSSAIGDFGGGFNLPEEARAHEGEWIHAGMWLYFPEDFSINTTTDTLKFWRWQKMLGDVSEGQGGKTEMHWLDGHWSWTGPSGPTGSIQGIGRFSESAEGDNRDIHIICSRLPPMGEWFYLEVAIRASADPLVSSWRIWINNQFVFEQIGRAQKWYGRKYNDLNGTPGLQTATAISTTSRTLLNSNQTLGNPMFCTYWNGGAPKDQTMYVDSICWAKDVDSMPATDEFGNKMMGSGVLAVTPIFADGFESGDSSHTQGGARWSATIGNVEVSDANPHAGNYSLEFLFPGKVDAANTDATQYFDLGDLYGELWLQWKLFIPENYAHPGTGTGGSNRKFLRLWSDDYTHDKGKVGISTWWPNTIQADWNSSYSSVAVGPKGAKYLSFVEEADKGKWMTVRVQFKAPTKSNGVVTPGTIRIWKNGALIIDDTDQLVDYFDDWPNKYRRGYLLGAFNHGFYEDTKFYIDDFVAAESEGALP